MPKKFVNRKIIIEEVYTGDRDLPIYNVLVNEYDFDSLVGSIKVTVREGFEQVIKELREIMED